MISLEPGFLISLAVASFLAIVFLQSGLDKAFDFSGSLVVVFRDFWFRFFHCSFSRLI